MKNITACSLIILVGLLSQAYAANESNLLLTMPPILAANMMDCNGVPGGTAVVDACGVCGGDGSSCPVPTVTSAGQVWMDRNLGASRVATSFDDSAAYGDLYQWGRGSDGHEKRNSPTTLTNSTTDTPDHGSFILEPDDLVGDWRTPQNDNFWKEESGANNPCPSGFRLPTGSEFTIERDSWSNQNSAGAYASPLKLVVAGYRSKEGGLVLVGSDGRYWTSTVDGISGRYILFRNGIAEGSNHFRAAGMSVRCIKN